MNGLPPSCAKRVLPFLFTFLCGSAALAQPAPTPPPAAPETPAATDAKTGAAKEAQDHFQRARQLFEEGDYALALVEFQRAYDLSPNYRVLYNIAQVEIQLFHYAPARVALEKFLKDGGSEIPAPRKTQAENDLRMLAERTAHLRIVTNPPSDVALDDQPSIAAPFAEPVLVNAGQRKVVASRIGYTPVTRYVTLAGGDRKELTIELTPIPDAPKSVVVVPRTTTHPTYTPAVVGWIATGTLALATGIVGGLYLSKEAEIERLSNPAVPVNRQAALDASASATRLSVAADVLGIAAVGAGLVSLYFTLRPPSAETVHPAAVGTFRVRPGLGGVTGSF